MNLPIRRLSDPAVCILVWVVVSSAAAAAPPDVPTPETPLENREPPTPVPPPEAPPDNIPPELLPPQDPPDVAAVKHALASAIGGAGDAAIVQAIDGVPHETVTVVVHDALSAADERVRRAAVVAAGSLGRKAPLVELVRALSDVAPAVVSQAATEIGNLKAKEGALAVSAALSHPSVDVRCAAAAALPLLLPKKKALAAIDARLGTTSPREIACLVPVFAGLGDPRGLALAVAALDEVDTHGILTPSIGRLPAKLLQKHLPAQLRTASEARVAGLLLAAELRPDGPTLAAGWLPNVPPERQATLARWLVPRAGAPGAQKALRALAGKGDPALRALIIDALSAQDARGLAPAARAWLADPAVVVRGAAARVFARTPDRREATLLVRAYQNERATASAENLPVRIALLEALGGAGTADQAALFADALGQPGEENAALEALVRLGAPSVPTLALIVKLADGPRTPFALEALARIGSGVSETAGRLLEDPREGVRKLGRDLLAASEDPASVAVLVKLFESDRIDDPVPVVQAIACFSSDAAIDALIRASDHPAATVRAAAAEGLGATQVDAKASLQRLVQLVETDADPGVRSTAIQALFRLGYPELPRLLVKLVQYDVAEVRTTAYDALAWMADPASVVVVGDRIGDAVSPEKDVLTAAVARLTRRTDLTSARAVRDWSASVVAARGPEGERSGVVAGDIQISLRAFGSGPTTLVLADGHAGASFASALAAAADSGRYVAVDGRGRGATPFGKKALTIAQEVEDVEAVRAALKVERIRLVAFASSAYVAAAYAKKYPNRINGLLLVSAPPKGGGDGGILAAARRLKGTSADDLAALDARFAWYAPSAYAAYRYVLLAPGLVGDAAVAPRLLLYPPVPHAAQALLRSSAGTDLAKRLAKLETPVLLVYGEHAPYANDALVGLKRLDESNPRVKIVRLPGLGHYPHLEQPSSLAAPLRDFQAMR